MVDHGREESCQGFRTGKCACVRTKTGTGAKLPGFCARRKPGTGAKLPGVFVRTRLNAGAQI
jgi:hypothetical protein